MYRFSNSVVQRDHMSMLYIHVHVALRVASDPRGSRALFSNTPNIRASLTHGVAAARRGLRNNSYDTATLSRYLAMSSQKDMVQDIAFVLEKQRPFGRVGRVGRRAMTISIRDDLACNVDSKTRDLYWYHAAT
jgi:hypothetical protein